MSEMLAQGRWVLRLMSVVFVAGWLQACDQAGLPPAASNSEGAQSRVAEADEAFVEEPVRLVIGLDLSKSNPLVDSENYAEAVGDFVAAYVEDLPFASVLMIRTFGAYDGSVNNLRVDRTISANNRPEDAAELVASIVGGVPRLVREGIQ